MRQARKYKHLRRLTASREPFVFPKDLMRSYRVVVDDPPFEPCKCSRCGSETILLISKRWYTYKLYCRNCLAIWVTPEISAFNRVVAAVSK